MVATVGTIWLFTWLEEDCNSELLTLAHGLTAVYVVAKKIIGRGDGNFINV